MAQPLPRTLWPARQSLITCARLDPSRVFKRLRTNAGPSSAPSSGYGRYSPEVIEQKTMEAVSQTELTRDRAEEVGLVRAIYVKPTGSKLPSWLHFKDRFNIEKLNLKQRAMGQMSHVVYWWVNRDLTGWSYKSLIPLYNFVSGTKPKIDLGLRGSSLIPFYNKYYNSAIGEAVRLHQEIFKCLAQGTPESLRKLKTITTKNLYETYANVVNKRSATTKIVWEAEKVLRKPVLLGDISTIIGGEDKTGQRIGLRQVVVRLQTRQKHEVFRFSTKAQKLSEQTRDVTEYMVLQQRIWHGELEGWKVVGFVDSQAPQEFEVAKQKAEELEALQRARQREQEMPAGV